MKYNKIIEMKAQELRIGNLVFAPWINKVVEVEEISYMDNSLIYKKELGEYALNDLAIDKYEPIPLTEQWLLKFGFVYSTKPVPDDVNPFKGLNFGHDFYQLGNIEFQSHYISYTDKTIAIWASDNYTIKYVHQLQNLIFALTGEELTPSSDTLNTPIKQGEK